MATNLEVIQSFYESGKYLSAYIAARDAGLLTADPKAAPEQATLVARILRMNGAPRRARKLLLETWRRHRDDPTARVHEGLR